MRGNFNMLKQFYIVIVAAVAVAVVVTACSGQSASPSAAAPTAAPTSIAQSATEAPRAAFPTAIAPTVAAPTAPPTVAAPTVAPTVAAPTAAATSAAQAATEAPRFTHPADITNPYYPISLTGQAISIGTEGGKPARNEVTLLPDTKMITWQGQQVEARVNQFVAYTDGRLVEVAYDYFAQADDGSVYYLGEDVSNYEDGKFVDHEGSWQTGKDGAPAALIMPAHPAVGQVFNPENLPGVVYETDEILSLTEKTTTPTGPTDQGMLVKETLMDGSIEHKVYAANFGIVEERADDEQGNLVLSNRTDAQPGTVPEPLSTIEAQAEDIIDVVPGGNWGQVASDVAVIAKAWQAYEAQAATDHVPQPFQEALTAALDRLQKSSVAKKAAGTMQEANDLSAAVADLFAVYHPARPVDLGRLDVLERQVVLDVAANDFEAAADSLAKANAVWARLKSVILAHNGADAATRFESSLTAQQKALDQENTSAVATEANKGLELVDVLENLFNQ
jgi:hypothetical protein